MKPTFDQLKQEFIEALRDKSPCQPEYRRVLASTTQEELLQIIYDNLHWCVRAGCISNEFFAKFDETAFLKSGIANTGTDNTGFANTGDRNTGYSNTGDRNTGYSNTGSGHSGAFCTGTADFPLFNKPSGMTYEQFVNSPVFNLLCQVDTKMWIQPSQMTDEEKSANPQHSTCEGYLKDIPFKQAFQDRWHNWSEQERKHFTSLPNFDAAIFEEITGVNVNQ